MSHTRLHNLWLTMRYRCSKPNCSGYSKYGAKGIKVSEEWYKSFEAFGGQPIRLARPIAWMIQRKAYI